MSPDPDTGHPKGRRGASRQKPPTPGSPTWNRLASTVLSQEDLWSLFSACVRNGKQLASEAQILLNAGSMARAYALAGTSLEETGKAMELIAIFVGRLAGYEFGPEDWVKFWSHWYSHGSKTEGAAIFENIVDSGIRKWADAPDEPPPSDVIVSQMREIFHGFNLDRIAEQGAQWHTSRQASLYVDWSGKVEEPEHVVLSEHAHDLVKRASEAATSMGYMGQAMEAISNEPQATRWLLGQLENLKSALD